MTTAITPEPQRTSTKESNDGAGTTAVSLWFGKSQSKNQRRYSVVAAWAYKKSTKQLFYALWRDQGPAPYLSNISAWISGLQPESVLVSCFGNTLAALKEDKNLGLWMEDIEEDLLRQEKFGTSRQNEGVDDDSSDTRPDDSKAVKNLTRVVPSAVPAQIHKDGVEILRSLVHDDPATLYQLQANPDLTTNSNAPTPPLLCAAAVLLQAVGLYQPTLGAQTILPIEEPIEDIPLKFSIQNMPATNFLTLDRAAASSLNVWPIHHAGQAAAEGATSWHASLYGLLSYHARTQMGKSQLQQWLLHPFIELPPLLERQDAVAYLVENGLVRQSLVDQGLQPLAGTNLEKLATQLESYEGLDETVGSMDEEDQDVNFVARNKPKRVLGSTRKALKALYELYLLASQKVPALAHHLEPILEENSSDNILHCNPSSSNLLKEHAESLMGTAKEIERAIDLCEAVIDLDQAPREYLVKPEHSPRLAELAQELAQWQADLDKCHEDMNDLWIDCAGLPPNSKTMYVRLHIPDTKNNGDASYEYRFRLTNTNDSKKLQEHKTLKQHKVTVHRLLKNGVYFSTPALQQLASQREQIDLEYDRHQRDVVAQAVSVAATYAPMIHGLRHSVAFLDAVAAMAQLAVFSPNGYCRPSFTDSNEDGHGICLKQARHPCVERQDNVDFIPNDIELTLGSNSCWLVTGPNMGGKSTFIRSLGAIVTLAQMGCYVPCESAKINLIHSISARVGAGDSQDRGISTFMSEMLESSAILQTATRRSLIIVDELGRGTSTFDGYGLARSICEYIVEKIQCLTVFATHFHELTASLPAQFPSGQIHNCHVSAVTTDNEVVFLYKVEDGPCLDSFGIQVAEMAQVPPQAITDARVKLRALEATSSYKRQKNEDDSDGKESNKRQCCDDSGKSIQSNDDVEWLAKFQKVNIPELLSKASDKALDNDTLKQMLLQEIR